MGPGSYMAPKIVRNKGFERRGIIKETTVLYDFP